MKYVVYVSELLSNNFVIEAENQEKAKNIAWDMYVKGDIEIRLPDDWVKTFIEAEDYDVNYHRHIPQIN